MESLRGNDSKLTFWVRVLKSEFRHAQMYQGVVQEPCCCSCLEKEAGCFAMNRQ